MRCEHSWDGECHPDCECEHEEETTITATPVTAATITEDQLMDIVQRSSTTLAEWMFPNDFEPRLGHHFTFCVPPKPEVGFDGLTVRCEVLELDPPRRLVFSWSAEGPVVNTRVSFDLEPEGESTRLRFEHSGFDTSLPWGTQAFKGATGGWANMLQKLAIVLIRSQASHKTVITIPSAAPVPST